ncbi:hypothetical protein NGR_c19010 [Sinorhizobium fredii NGR234]|uniref:Uncharacterized protein n=1 Tax=Sinorhizobium fredii (strain NBRC 101917 / NGR234) TaxID=394 RepID=C3MDZ6_SINFN|nr:DUF6258 family protein [Sinorhizobium fredii]ACP25665.1 hypothetical protein NGR_c19010 [Sinorhizobium fredii NGR234]
MNPDEFLRSIYLGDRACKVIVLDGWKKEVKIQIDSISRLRSGTWNYDENIHDGFLVFEGVDHISFDPPGIIPNDDFGDIEFLGFEDGRFTVMIDMGFCDEAGVYGSVKTKIRAKAVAIEKPGEEGTRIRD